MKIKKVFLVLQQSIQGFFFIVADTLLQFHARTNTKSSSTLCHYYTAKGTDMYNLQKICTTLHLLVLQSLILYRIFTTYIGDSF